MFLKAFPLLLLDCLAKELKLKLFIFFPLKLLHAEEGDVVEKIKTNKRKKKERNKNNNNTYVPMAYS